MAKFCTVETLGTHAINISIAICVVALSLGISIPLSRLFVKTNCPERGIYQYALAFANSGYMGDPIVQSLFGEEALSYYKLFCLPLTIMIYTWGISVLVPKGENKKSFFKKILNAPTVAMLIGIVVGITGLGEHMPEFLTLSLNSLKGCMGPVAMLLAGFTVANYSVKAMLKNTKVYVATALRLIVIPSIIIGATFGLITLANLAFGLEIGNTPLFLAFFAIATPLGLNTVVFPEAYGGDPKTGAAMATISHTLCVITIPLMYALLCALFGEFSI
jgi:predicted permease